MGRNLLTVGFVVADACVSGVSWSCEAPLAWVGFTSVTSVIGLVFAAKSMAARLAHSTER